MLIKPSIPLIADGLAHTFWYANHIATVHFENGKYHIHKEILEDSKKTYPEKNSSTTKTSQTVDEHVSINVSLSYFCAIEITNKIFARNCNLLSQSLKEEFRPPKFNYCS